VVTIFYTLECVWGLSGEQTVNFGIQLYKCFFKASSGETQNQSIPVCPMKCHQYDNCFDCLRNPSGETGGKGKFGAKSVVTVFENEK